MTTRSIIQDEHANAQLNIRGPYLMTRSFLPLMLRCGDKQVVNLSSIGAHLVRPGMSGYQTSKMAIVRFSEFINAEYGEQGVVAFSVHPGGIMTDLARTMPKEMHHGGESAALR